MKKIYDYIIGLSLIAICGLFYMEAQKINESYGDSKVFPYAIMVLILLLSVIIIVKAALRPKEKSTEDPFKGSKRVWIAALIMMLYVVLINMIGFRLATPFYIVFASYQLGQRNKVAIIATAILLPIVVWLSFGVGFGIPLPRGSLIAF